MTPFETRAEYLGLLREKARHILREDGHTSRFAREMLDQYYAQTDGQVDIAIGSDWESFHAFQDNVTTRIATAFESRQLVPLRCPACARITFTPETRQCVWCGHDWHNT
jgi:hypothetical protein